MYLDYMSTCHYSYAPFIDVTRLADIRVSYYGRRLGLLRWKNVLANRLQNVEFSIYVVVLSNFDCYA